MNWDAVGALAGVFGAAAVVVSLVYLAAQIRQSGRVSSAAAFQGIIDGITEHFRYMALSSRTAAQPRSPRADHGLRAD